MIERLPVILFWSALALAFTLASVPHPPALPYDPNDKIVHMLAFAVLGGLAAIAFPRHALLTLFLSLAAFGAFIEVVQAIPALQRDASLLDWLADLAAAGGMLLTVGWARAILSSSARDRIN